MFFKNVGSLAKAYADAIDHVEKELDGTKDERHRELLEPALQDYYRSLKSLCKHGAEEWTFSGAPASSAARASELMRRSGYEV